MKKAILRNLILIAILFIGSELFGQSTTEFPRTDVVYLKNGSIFRGQIQFYEVGGELKLKIEENRVIIFKSRNIKKIVQEATDAERKGKYDAPEVIKEYAFKENGLYFAAHMGYIGGNNLRGNYTNGFNTHFNSGFQFNRLVGAGMGVGVDFYNVSLGSVIPIYAELRGYLCAKNVSPYYQLAGGYGFPIVNENSSFTQKKGGYYLAPTFGIRFGGSADENFTLGLGLQWQRAKYTTEFGDGISQIEDTYTFRRFNLKMGILF